MTSTALKVDDSNVEAGEYMELAEVNLQPSCSELDVQVAQAYATLAVAQAVLDLTRLLHATDGFKR